MYLYYYLMRAYEITKEYSWKAIKASYDAWIGQPLTLNQYYTNHYLMLKAQLGLEIEDKDYEVDPLGNKEHLEKYKQLLEQSRSIKRAPFTWEHLYSFGDGEDHTYMEYVVLWAKAPFIFASDYLETVVKSYNLTGEEQTTLNDGYNVLLLNNIFRTISRYLFNNYNSTAKSLKFQYKLTDFIHDEATRSIYSDPNKPNSGSGSSGIPPTNEQLLASEWSKHSDNNGSILSNSISPELFPFSALDDYKSIQLYYLYKNSGVNYVKYSTDKSYSSIVEKMLSYSSSNMYNSRLNTRFSFDWNSIILKVFNLDYRDTFINPLFNFVNNRSYDYYRHTRADSLIYSASIYRAVRRPLVRKGAFTNYPGIRQFLEDKDMLAQLVEGGGSMSKFKKLRTQHAASGLKGSRFKSSKFMSDRKDHMPTDLSDKHTVFYDFLNYYREKANINPLSRLSYKPPKNKGYQVYSNSNLEIPGWSGYEYAPLHERIGSRLYRKMGYIDSNLESDTKSVHVTYINKLKDYLNSDSLLKYSSFDTIDKLYNSYLKMLSTAEKNTLFDLYFFRHNYLKDRYNRFNFTNLIGRTGSSSWKKSLIGRNKYTALNPPSFVTHEYTQSLKPFNVKIGKYDLLTRFKLELISSSGLNLSRFDRITYVLNTSYYNLWPFDFITLQQLFTFGLSGLSLFSLFIFDFYVNFEMVWYSFFNDLAMYPWMNPIIKNMESFWYSSRYFHLSFDSLTELMNQPSLQHGYNLSDFQFNSPYDLLKSSNPLVNNSSESILGLNNSLYTSNKFFDNQYAFYNYQSKNLIKLPYFPIHNSSILFFQWDNLPLFDLVSQGSNTNLYKHFELMTYNILKYDLYHLFLLLIKDIYFNLTFSYDDSIVYYFYYTFLSGFSFFINLVSFLLSYCFSSASIWFIGLFLKLGLSSSLEVLNLLTNSVTLLNLKHLFIDVPYWYVVDTVTASMFHWKYWLMPFHQYFNGTYWVPLWYIYDLFDNYFYFYFVQFLYSYYTEIANSPNNLMELVYANYCLAIYWVIIIPLFYLLRLLIITILIESYGFFAIFLILFVLYLTAWNTTKQNAWVFKGMSPYLTRSWVLNYHAIHDTYLRMFLHNNEMLSPYKGRLYSSANNLISAHYRTKNQIHNTVPIARNPNVGISHKFPKYQLNYYNYPNIVDHLFNTYDVSDRKPHDLDHSRNKGTSGFYKNILFSKEYVLLNQALKFNLSKFPLFGSYPEQVQPYYRKALYQFGQIHDLNRHLFQNTFDYLIPFILLGKHYEDRNFIASIQIKEGHLLKNLYKSDRIYHTNNMYHHRYYFLRKYFPFYYRHSTSLFRLKSLYKRYRYLGTTPQTYNIQYKYLLWDSGSHNMFLFPGISSLFDEYPSELLEHSRVAYEETFVDFYYKDDSTIFESDVTDGVHPTFDHEFNFGTQYSELIAQGSFKLIHSIERQRRIIYTMTSYRPGFDHLFNEKASKHHGFFFKLLPQSRTQYRKGKNFMDGMGRYALDRVQEYYYNSFSTGRNMEKDIKYILYPYSEQTSSTRFIQHTELDFKRVPYRRGALSFSNSWYNYKTSLLWFLNELKRPSSYLFKKNSWVRDFDLGSLSKDSSIEFNLLQENQLYPSFFYNTTGDDYVQSHAWYRIFMLHSLNPRYVKHRAEHWEFSNSWNHDMTFVDNRDITDGLTRNTFSTTISELLDDGTLNGKMIPPVTEADLRKIYMNSITVPRRKRNYLNSVYRQDVYTRKIFMGKYYRLLHTISSIGINNYFQSLPMTAKRSYSKMHPSQHLFHSHYIGRVGKLDFFAERFSYDFDNGWVQLFNIINYKKYKHQIPAIEKPSRLFNRMLRDTDTQERLIKDITSLDSFANSLIFSSFYDEFGDLSSGIYHAWLSQQSYRYLNSEESYDFFSYYHKHDYLLGNYRLNDQYSYSKFAMIKDSLRDSHNYMDYTTGNSNYPISLKDVENYYEYDRYTSSPWPLDVRTGSMYSQLNQVGEPIRPGEGKTGYSYFRHFRGKGSRVFNYHREQLHPRKYRLSFDKDVSFLDYNGRTPNSLMEKQDSLLDLLNGRILSEAADHYFNLFDINLEIAKVDYKPIIFYKVPKSIGDNWIDFQKSIIYYDWYDKQPLNDLKQDLLTTHGGSWKYHYLTTLLETEEYDYIFESNLKNRFDGSLDYKLLEHYCEREVTGGLLTNRYLIYREKIKSISPNASLFFHDFYPDYIWEFYEFNWYDQVRSDWFFLIPCFALFIIYYTGVPQDYYKFSHKRLRQTLYVNHIKRRKTGGPKNFHRRLFPQPNKLKKRRLSFYRLQSKNNMINAHPLTIRYNLRASDYLRPYNIINPTSHSFISRSFLRYKTRLHRSRRVLNPKKYVFYSGYNIQLRLNRRKARQAFRRRLKIQSKEQLYSTLKLMRGIEPYYATKLKDQEFDRYKKSWVRDRAPKSRKRYHRNVNYKRKPMTKPFRRHYSFDFYKTMLSNDLMKLFLIIKVLISSTIGSVWILFLHFLKYPFSYSKFKYTLLYVWDHKYELIPSFKYLNNFFHQTLLPRFTYMFLYLTANSNPYTAPFSFSNRKKITRHWKHSRRNFRDRMALYSSVPFTFFNYFLIPVYKHLFVPFYKLSLFVVDLERQLLTTVISNASLSTIFMKLNVLKRLLGSGIVFHKSKLYSYIVVLFYSVFYLILHVFFTIYHFIIINFIRTISPILKFSCYLALLLIKSILYIIKPLIYLIKIFNQTVVQLLMPFNLVTFYITSLFNTWYCYVRLIWYYLYFILVSFIYKPIVLVVTFLITFNLELLFLFYRFYTLNVKLIVLKFLNYVNLDLFYNYNRYILYILHSTYFLVKPIFKYFTSLLYSIIMNLIYLIYTSFLMYVEPIIYYTFYIVNVSYNYIRILKYKSYLLVKQIIPTFNLNALLLIGIKYLNLFTSLALNFIWTLITPILKLFIYSTTFLIRELISSYLIVYMILFLATLLITSAFLNFSIVIISITVLLKSVVSSVLFFVVSLNSIVFYAIYLFFSPGLYYILAAFKLIMFIVAIIIKLLVLNVVCIVYLIFNIVNCYIEYFYTDMSFLDFLVNIYHNVIINAGDYIYHSVVNYFRNMITFLYKYPIYNFFYDGNCNFDRYTSEASAEFHRSYTYLKNQSK